MDERPFSDLKRHRRSLRLLIGNDLRIDISKRIPLHAVEIRHPRDVVADLRHPHDVPFFELGAALELFLGKDRLSLVSDLGELESRPLNNGKTDGEPLLVLTEIHGRRADLDIEISLIQVGLPDSFNIVGDLVLLVNP